MTQEKNPKRQLTSAEERAASLRPLLAENGERVDAGRRAFGSTPSTEPPHSWRAELYEEHLQGRMLEDEKARSEWLGRRSHER